MHVFWGGAEREREKEREKERIPSRLCTDSRDLHLGFRLKNCEIMTQAKVRCLTD